MKILINKKNLKINFKNSFKVKKKLIKYKEHSLIIFGNCYEIIKKEYIFNNVNKILNFNGEFFFIYKNKIKNQIILGNSFTSYYQIYFYENSQIIKVSLDIFSLVQNNSKLNFKKISEWLFLNGRNLNQKTFIKNIKILHPGVSINLKNFRSRLVETKPFNYDINNIKNLDYENELKNELVKAIKLRLNKVNSNITFGLSGGYDSRILLSLVPNKHKKKIFTKTIGDKYSLEKISAKKVAKFINVKHKNILVKKSSYYKFAHNILDYGNYNNIFKAGIKNEIYKKIFKMDKSNHFIQGNALDVLIGSSFSDRTLFKIKNLNQYLNWYLVKNELFNLSEIKNIFNNKSFLKKNSLKKDLIKRIQKIRYYNDYVDLNDALTFDLRIKRWHNSTLSVFIPITNMLIPTYDKFFLKTCSKIPSKLRINDKFRKRFLKNVNQHLFCIPNPEELSKLKKYKKFHTFDSDLGNDFKTSKKFKNFFKNLISNNSDDLKNLIDLKYIKMIISTHINSDQDFQRKIFMIITLLLFFKKFNNSKKVKKNLF